MEDKKKTLLLLLVKIIQKKLKRSKLKDITLILE